MGEYRSEPDEIEAARRGLYDGLTPEVFDTPCHTRLVIIAHREIGVRERSAKISCDATVAAAEVKNPGNFRIAAIIFDAGE